MDYQKVSEPIISELRSILGDSGVVTDPEKMEAYSHDEVPETRWRHLPEVVVKPENTCQVAQVMKLANREKVPVTPRGAGTGLAAGAVPFLGGIVLSLEKMNRIIEVDRQNLVMVVEPGVTTGDVQKCARDHGYLYAGDPCSADSSFIGGNIATNAGGNKAVKYGCTSKHVNGLEVVLPSGEVTTLGGKCVKDVTGYDLLHLIVGSEGTLGIATRIYLKLLPRPRFNAVLMVPFSELSEAIDLVPRLMTQGGIVPTSIEFMDQTCIRSAERFLDRQLPHNTAGAHLIIELDSSTETQLLEEMEQVSGLCGVHGCQEVFVGDNPATQEKIWKPRRVLAESLRVTSPTYCMEDIVVPVSHIPGIVKEINRIADQQGIVIACFGHAGDGNIHATLLKGDLPDDVWEERKGKALDLIYSEVYARGGNLSGEHGIGAKRKEALSKYLDPVKMKTMKAIKLALDPNLVLNPGKIFDVRKEV
ncbi:MAG: FAD-binding oxidoreductase [Firmicutes bacterium]|nr:FAD-binding oxidoreductase [Bacillota bacterium]